MGRTKLLFIGVSHWHYDAQAVASRNHSGETEQKFMAEWNALLQEKFHIESELRVSSLMLTPNKIG